ncbi:hypothetical protein KEM56_003133 [Ascosphaera pollenicola]|nr:hypothetical protein KEM56_003133 [Ascosphaera pollenicola]
MPLKASVINASGGNITYHVECDESQTATRKCNIPAVTITEIDRKTYQGEASKLGMDINIACTARPKNEMFCSNSVGGALASGIGILNSAFGGDEKATSVASTATSNDGGFFGLPKTSTYPSSEVGKVVVAITAGVQKLASASSSAQTTEPAATGSGTLAVESTGTNAGLPRATGNAELYAGGALAALALAF